MIVELTVASTAFVMGAALPIKFTGFGADVSPPLAWSAAPSGTVSLVVLCDDPDAPAGDWVHWVLFNLPADTRELKEGVPPQPKLPNGAVQGLNDFGAAGWRGPTPPPGKPHRYVFKVCALDTRLVLGPAARKKDVEQAMAGHLLAQGRLVGTFQRPPR